MSDEQNREPTEETGRQDTGDTASGEESGGAVDFTQLPPELKVAALTERLEAAEAEAEKFRNEVQYKEAELQNERRRFAEQRAAVPQPAGGVEPRHVFEVRGAVRLAVLETVRTVAGDQCEPGHRCRPPDRAAACHL